MYALVFSDAGEASLASLDKAVGQRGHIPQTKGTPTAQSLAVTDEGAPADKPSKPKTK